MTARKQSPELILWHLAQGKSRAHTVRLPPPTWGCITAPAASLLCSCPREIFKDRGRSTQLMHLFTKHSLIRCYIPEQAQSISLGTGYPPGELLHQLWAPVMGRETEAMARRNFCPSLVSLPPSDRLVQTTSSRKREARADGEGRPLSDSTIPGRPLPSHRISWVTSNSFMKGPHQAQRLRTISRDLGPRCGHTHPMTHLSAEVSIPPCPPHPSLTTCPLFGLTFSWHIDPCN